LEIESLKEEIRQIKQKRIGLSTEAFNAFQYLYFRLSAIAKAKLNWHKPTTINKTSPAISVPLQKRVVLADRVPRERFEIDLTDEKIVCPCFQETMTEIGEDITKNVEFVPATLKVKKYARVNYACKHCQGHIRRAELPATILPKCVLSDSIQLYIIVRIFFDHLPVLRIECQYARLAIYMPRSTQYRALIAVSEKAQPIIDIRSTAVGRKKYLQVGYNRGGHAVAAFYCLVETAKTHHTIALQYLTDVLERLSLSMTKEDYRALAPQYWKPTRK